MNARCVAFLGIGAPIFFWSFSSNAHSCQGDDALSVCVEPNPAWSVPANDASHGYNRYEAASIRYFLTMKTNQHGNESIAEDSLLTVGEFLRPLEHGEWNPVNKWFQGETIHPRYHPEVIRFEHPPWLLTTGFGASTMKHVDEALRFYETDYETIDCRFFEKQPFARCHVVFLYGHDDPDTPEDERRTCPIYEEFTFDQQGNIVFIEAWTDYPGYLPMDPADHWAEEDGVYRMSTKIPGLGGSTGSLEFASPTMQRAAAEFDASFDAPYMDHHSVNRGLFQSMLHDVTGHWNGRSMPFAGALNIWPEWAKRASAHSIGSALDGCDPPSWN